MKRLKSTDVVIIGSGFSGLVMAKEITSKTRLNVVVLERGPARSLEKYVEEMNDIDILRVGLRQNPAEDTITLRNNNKQTSLPLRLMAAFHAGTGTGGASEAWAGYAHRSRPDHLVLATHLREKYGASRIPPNCTVHDWGITYDQFEQYFWQAEQLMGVSGKAGNLNGKLIPGGNIFEGPRSHEFPNPPLTPTYAMTFFYRTAQALDYHPYPVPSAIASQNYTNQYGVARPGCFYSGFCINHGCKSGARAMPTSVLLPALENEKNFTLRNNSWVRKIVHRDGHAEGVIYMDENGEETMQPAGLVILAAWTPNNVRLLYLSGIGDPYDPETGKGTLGMNLTHQVNPGGGGGVLVYEEPLNLFMTAASLVYAVSDVEGDLPEDVPEGILRGGFLHGGAVQGYSALNGFGQVPPEAAPRNWGSKWKKAAIKYWDHVGPGVSISADTFPYRHNYMDLDPTYTDKWGDPLLRFTMDYTEYEQRQFAWGARICTHFTQKLAEVSKAKLIPFGQGGRGRPGSGGFRHYSGARYNTTHIQGGAIMGTSPDQSVLNTWLQHWKVPNLFVVGSNALPQEGSAGPTTTIVALAYRAADGVTNHYVKRPGLIG